MNHFIRLFLFSLISFTGFGVTSCKKFTNVELAPNLLDQRTVFETEGAALAAVSGVYVKLRSSNIDMSNAGLSVLTALSSDELYNTTANVNYDAFSKNALLNTTNNVLQGFWRAPYRNIYSINAVIEGLEVSTALPSAIRTQYIAEMKTVRAWYYFYLVNLFGAVPLVLQTNYEANAVMPRTTVEMIYKQLISDLKQAKSVLPLNYPSAGKARVNKWTAAALLSRVYLYQQQWDLAAAEASEIIASNTYALLTDLSSVFLINSRETIWEVAPNDEASNTAIGTLIVPSSMTSRPTFALQSALLSKFHTTDARFTLWIRSNLNAGTRYYYPYKFKQRTLTSPIQEYNTMIRYDEVLLIRAEAYAEMNELELAAKDLNLIRVRAGLTERREPSQALMLEAIHQERQLELFCEWGHRWFDLKRSGKLDAVLIALKGGQWQVTDALYPIPLAEMNYNPYLTQNPGY